MKTGKSYRFDPFSALSYHDLTQEARRLRRANRKLRKAIRHRANEEGDFPGTRKKIAAIPVETPGHR